MRVRPSGLSKHSFPFRYSGATAGAQRTFGAKRTSIPGQRDWVFGFSMSLLCKSVASRVSRALRLQRWEAQDVAPLASLGALVLLFSLFAPGFLRLTTAVAVMEQGAVLAIVAAGLTFVLLTGEIDLAVGMTALWSATFCGWLFQRLATEPVPGQFVASWPVVLLVLALPLASCLVLGVASGTITVMSRLPSFIISLAMMFIAQGAATYISRGAAFRLPKLLSVLGNGGILEYHGLRLIPYSAILAATVMVLGHVVLQHTRFGRYVYMTGGNRQAARLAGVRTGLIIVACLAISAVAAGVGGLINAGRMTSVTLDQNVDLLLNAVACVVLGGTSLFGGEGSMGKTAIGVITFTVLGVGLNQMHVDDFARQLLTGVVLLGALILNGFLARRR